MRRLLFISLVLFFSQVLHAQLSLDWEKSFGCPVTYYEETRVAGTDAFGNLYVAGERANKRYYFLEEAWLAKFSPSGELIWKKGYPEFSFFKPASLCFHPNGNLVLIGDRKDSINPNRSDIFQVYFDSSGNVISSTEHSFHPLGYNPQARGFMNAQNEIVTFSKFDSTGSPPILKRFDIAGNLLFSRVLPLKSYSGLVSKFNSNNYLLFNNTLDSFLD